MFGRVNFSNYVREEEIEARRIPTLYGLLINNIIKQICIKP